MTAPTTRADHAELARIAEQCRLKADKLGCDEWRAPALLKQASRGLEALLSEIAALRAAGEIIAQKAENAIQQGFAHIERATQAERQRDEAVVLLKQFHTRIMMERRCNSLGVNVAEPIMEKTRAFLANQGAE